MAYLLDTNIFITAKNEYYGLDFCPAFWDWLAAENKSKNVFSVEKVGNEMQAGDDELKDWAATQGSGFFLKPNSLFPAAMAKVSAWANNSQKYRQAAVNQFLTVADCYLVAQALSGQHVVVTNEVSAPGSVYKIKIPDACDALGVERVRLYEMLRRSNARFVLEAA